MYLCAIVPFCLSVSVSVLLSRIAVPTADSALFHEFEDMCVRAYQVLRKHANLIIALFAMMLSTDIPEVSWQALLIRGR